MKTLQNKKLNFLVLEDDPFQSQALAATLNRMALATVHCAENEKAIATFLDQHPDGFDITLCDLRLDTTDCIEVLENINDRRLGSIIITSGLSVDIQSAAEKILKDKGFKVLGCLPKPIDKIRLRQILKHYVKRDDLEPMPIGPSIDLNLDLSPNNLENALKKHEFIAYYQPKLILSTNELAGVEVLCRWHHPEYGLVSPIAFIDAFEKHDLIEKLTDSMLRQACTLGFSWPSQLRPINFALNASASTLENPIIVRHWRSLLKEFRLSPKQITFELTETALPQDETTLFQALATLRINGFKVSLDDFGTGYTSLNQLRKLPISEIKIDRSFVTGASTNAKSAAIVASILQLATSLRLNTVAEGIETAEDADFLNSLGCHEGQGYYFAKPMPEEALKLWVESHVVAQKNSN